MIHTTRMLLVPEELFKRMQTFYNRITGGEGEEPNEEMGRDIQYALQHQRRKTAQKIAEDYANRPLKVELYHQNRAVGMQQLSDSSESPSSGSTPFPPPRPRTGERRSRRERSRSLSPRSRSGSSPHERQEQRALVEQPRLSSPSPAKTEEQDNPDFPFLSFATPKPSTSQYRNEKEKEEKSGAPSPPKTSYSNAHSSSSSANVAAAATPPPQSQSSVAVKVTPKREVKKKLKLLIGMEPAKYAVEEDVIFHPATGDIVKHSNVDAALDHILGIRPSARAPNGANILQYALEKDEKTKQLLTQLAAQQQESGLQHGSGRSHKPFMPRLWPLD